MMFRRAADFDPESYARLMQMPMNEAIPFVERWFEKLIEAKEQARKLKRK
jgi:hypothetical protein